MLWYKYLIVFAASFVWILGNTFQVRNAAQGRVLPVIMTSFMMGTITVFVQRNYMEDDLAAVCYVAGGCLGAGAGVALHKLIYKKKVETHE